ncbi:hypothetical protein IL306_010484 [Fusarium sp. DS 682]|nr:hypothetical protein IL306_010484 [Fusarium sp. DS 682]
MEKKHSSRWTEEVHKAISWCCDTDHEEQYFTDEGGFDEHIQAHHQDYKTKDEIAEHKEWCEVKRARPPYTCPICSCVPEDIATVAPWLIKRSSSIQNPGSHQSRSASEAELRSCLLRHIASHLKSLGFMSIMYLGDEEDEPQACPIVPGETDENKGRSGQDSEQGEAHVFYQESPGSPNSSSRFFSSTKEAQYDELLEKIRSQLRGGVEKRNTTEKFATRGMVKNVISRSTLKDVYECLKAATLMPATDTDQINASAFADIVQRKMLQHFLAVLIYAKCSVNAMKSFADRLVFGNEADFRQDQETPNLLPATKSYLEALFSKRSDAQDFFDEQRTFCTVVLGGIDILTLRSDDQRSMPWLEQEKIGSGAFGVVYKVTIAQGHLAMDGDFNHVSANPMVVARKDFICVDTAEASFKKEVEAIRDVFNSNRIHDNILKSFGTLLIEGKPSIFSLVMPLAELDLQEYMRRNLEIPIDISTRESILRSAMGLASGLNFLHNGMHTPQGDQLVCYNMDLKPSNILIFHDHHRKSGVTHRDMIWKLSDFYLSRVKKKTRPQEGIIDLRTLFKTHFKEISSQASAPQNLRRTDMFLPVEAELESQKMNEKSDIWSLGCIISLLFTYLGEGYKGVEAFSVSRLRYGNRNVDYFYEYNKYGTGFAINRAVVAQHEKLIKFATERSRSEGVATKYMLKALESVVLVIDQDSRCSADTIVELLKATLQKYSAVESEFIVPEIGPIPVSPRQIVKNYVSDRLLGRRNRQPTIQANVRRWRLDSDKSLRYKDCVCSPDGSRLAYWTEKVITLFDDRSGLSNSIPYRGTDSVGPGTSSTRIEQEQVLTIAGQHVLEDWSLSWRSVKLTDRYLIAATTDEVFNSLLRSISADRRGSKHFLGQDHTGTQRFWYLYCRSNGARPGIAFGQNQLPVP